MFDDNSILEQNSISSKSNSVGMNFRHDQYLKQKQTADYYIISKCDPNTSVNNTLKQYRMEATKNILIPVPHKLTNPDHVHQAEVLNGRLDQKKKKKNR